MGSIPSLEHLADPELHGGLPLPIERLASLLQIASDWYWEQDEQFRFTVLRGRADRPSLKSDTYLGTTRWARGEVPLADGGCWNAHIAALEAHQPFSEYVLKRVDRDGELRFISSSGVPVFDAAGSFRGYCGVAKDVTEAMRDDLRLTLQYGVTHTLAESDRISTVATSIVRVFCETLGWECGACFGFDEAAQAIGCMESWGVPGSPLSGAVEALRMEVPLPAAPILARQAAWTRGIPTWHANVSPGDAIMARPELLATGLTSVFCVPIKIEGKVAGVLEFLGRDHVIPDPGLPEYAALIGSQMGEFYRRVKAQQRMRESEERFRALVELSSDWYWEQDENYRFVGLAGASIFTIDEVVGKTRWELPIIATETQWADHKALLAAHQPFRDTEFQTRTNGETRYTSVSGVPLFDRHGRFKGYHGVSRDITAKKLSDERIQYLATHDGLTGLPNRTMFSTVLNMALTAARRYERKFAVVFVDLDRFKIINDTLGHDAGDLLLKEIANRLSRSLRASDLVARLGGDEFVVLVQEIEDDKQAARVARKILSAVIKPIKLLGQECRVTASVGISMFPRDAQDETTLMKNADIAMYLAKEEGKNNYQFFTSSIKQQTLERLTLETALRRALERREMSLHYQAKLDLKSGRINGAEALLRWKHPELGMVSPAQFIPLAEETGLIVPIGRWVLKTACAQNMAWQRMGLAPVCMAVNLSPRQFNDDHLLRDIALVLAETGMNPELLELEITEGMVMQDSQRTARVLAEIKKLGIKLAIDDFGTGYSSLAQIKRFPIDTIKVDRSFIRNLPMDAEDKAITQAIIAMGKTLSLTVVAEGVETCEQEAFLREHSCDETQGYYFNKPCASDAFEKLLREHVSK